MNLTTTRIAAAGLIGFVVAAALTGFLTPRYDARRETISALAARDNDHAWLMVAGFVCAAVGLEASAAVLWRQVEQTAARAGAVLVTAGAAGMVVAGFARQDCSERLRSCVDHGTGSEASTSFWVHQYVSLLTFALVIAAAFLVAGGLRRTGRHGLGLATAVAGLCSLACVVLLVVEPGPVTASYGLLQRLFVLLLLGWPLFVATTVTRVRLQIHPIQQKEKSRA